MLNCSCSLAKMASSADYSAMNYSELLQTKLAFSGAVELQINPLLKTKRQEEMANITHFFMTAMKTYGATWSEMITCLEKEGVWDAHLLTDHLDVDDQPADGHAGETLSDHQDGEPTLALPEHIEDKEDCKDKFIPWDVMLELISQSNEEFLDKIMSTPPKMKHQDTASTHPDDIDFWEYWESLAGGSTQEEETSLNETVDETTWSTEDNLEWPNEGAVAAPEETLAAKALSMAEHCRIPREIDAHASYFVDYTICFKDSEMWVRHKYGRNLDEKDLEDFRAVSEAYMKIFGKKEVLMSTEDYLICKEGEYIIKVRLYHFPEEEWVNVEESKSNSYSNHIPDYVTIDINKTHRRMRGAIEKAKKYSESLGSSSAPFYDRYVFYDNGAYADLKEGPDRNIMDVDSLANNKTVFETYSRLYNEDMVIISDEDCVAVKQHSNIYVVVFNYPDQKKTIEHVTKRRGRPKKSASTAKEVTSSEASEAVTSTSTTQTVDDLIQKAVDLTRDLPLTNGTDVKSTYYLQSSFSVTNEGALIYNGKPFSSNVSLDDLDRCRRKHEKYARTMKASKIVAADGYTAFVYNDGKTITVYYYSTKAANACNY